MLFTFEQIVVAFDEKIGVVVERREKCIKIDKLETTGRSEWIDEKLLNFQPLSNIFSSSLCSTLTFHSL